MDNTNSTSPSTREYKFETHCWMACIALPITVLSISLHVDGMGFFPETILALVSGIGLFTSMVGLEGGCRFYPGGVIRPLHMVSIFMGDGLVAAITLLSLFILIFGTTEQLSVVFWLVMSGVFINIANNYSWRDYRKRYGVNKRFY